MQKQETNDHLYILPSGDIVTNQKEGCEILKIGRNAFRNKVRNGTIKKVQLTNRPNGYHGKQNRN